MKNKRSLADRMINKTDVICMINRYDAITGISKVSISYRFVFALTAGLLLLAACKKDNTEKPLRANFEPSKTELLTGDSIVFKDISEGQAANWKWEFEGGDPASSELSGPIVKYNKPGTYAVTLTITNQSTTSTETRSGFIKVGYRQVAAAFTISKTTINQNDSVTFTDKSTGMPNKWAWEFRSADTAIIADIQNPVIKFTKPGVYTITLKATNPAGEDTEVKKDSLKVIDLNSVQAAFTSNSRSTYSGGSLQFNDASVGIATSWAWTFEGADITTSFSKNPVVTYSTPGRYKVKLVAANSILSSTIEKAAYVLVVPGNGLTAFYPLDGSIDDAGPSKLISQAKGTISYALSDSAGAHSATAVFNGTGGFYVPDNDAMNFGTGDYTVSVWYKTSTASRGMIWQESGALGSADNQTWLRILGTATNLTSFSTEDQTGGSTINLTTANSGTTATTNDGIWHHVVCVRSGAATTLYIDGKNVLGANSATGTKNTSNSAGFKVGMQEGTAGFSNAFNGQIDDLIIYKRALTVSEINALKDL